MVTAVISALGLLATAMGGVLWIINETARDQDIQRNQTEKRITTRMDSGFEYLDKRQTRQDQRHQFLIERVLDNRERILQLENPKQETGR